MGKRGEPKVPPTDTTDPVTPPLTPEPVVSEPVVTEPAPTPEPRPEPEVIPEPELAAEPVAEDVPVTALAAEVEAPAEAKVSLDFFAAIRNLTPFEAGVLAHCTRHPGARVSFDRTE